MALAPKRATPKLPPEVNRILYVRNLPYKIATEELYQIFGKYGAVHQIRIGNTNETRGTGYVVYEDIFEAKNACDNLSGFSVGNRYLIVQYYQAHKMFERIDNEKKERELEMLKKRYGLNNND